MSNYKALFDICDMDTSQVLMTEEDVDSVAHIETFHQIMDSQIEYDTLPIVNENDITTISEQVFGGNKHDDTVMDKLVTDIPKAELEKPDAPTHEFATSIKTGTCPPIQSTPELYRP
jgi:glutamate 5-kinase